MLRALLTGLLLLANSHGAMAHASRFDGAWNVVLSCPPQKQENDDANGYTNAAVQQMPAGLTFRAVVGLQVQCMSSFRGQAASASALALARASDLKVQHSAA